MPYCLSLLILAIKLMSTEELLSSLDLDDRILHILEINFEEQFVTLLLDDTDEEFYVRFHGVKSFFTTEPKKLKFPRDKIIGFHCEQLPTGLYKAQIMLDIDYAKACQNIIIIFERIEASSDLMKMNSLE